MGQDGGPQAQGALKAAMPVPSPAALQSKDSVPKAGSPLEDSSSSRVHPGEISGAKTLPLHLGGQGSPGQLCLKPCAPRHGLASWGEGLVTAQGGTLPRTKTSAREGGPGCSLTLPKVRAPSTHRDSIQLAKRHHSQPQAGPAHFNHVVSIEIGTLSALPSSSLPKVEAGPELREEPEKMEMEEQPPAGKMEEVDLENKPPTPPLHRFPSWVRGPLGTGQRGWADGANAVGHSRVLSMGRGCHPHHLWEVGTPGPVQTTPPTRGGARISDWTAAGCSLSRHSPRATAKLGAWCPFSRVVFLTLRGGAVWWLRARVPGSNQEVPRSNYVSRGKLLNLCASISLSVKWG